MENLEKKRKREKKGEGKGDMCRAERSKEAKNKGKEPAEMAVGCRVIEADRASV